MTNAAENPESLSALVDGQLGGDAFDATLDWLARDADARSNWDAYHVLGDVLRAGQAGSSLSTASNAAFMQRLKQSLAQEPQPDLRPIATDHVATYAMPSSARALKGLKKEAANDDRFYWKLVAGVASLFAAFVVGWQGLAGAFDTGGAPQMAQVIVPTDQSLVSVPQGLVQSEPGVMIRDPQLDALMAAHQQFGAASVLQGSSGFLRHAVFEVTAP